MDAVKILAAEAAGHEPIIGTPAFLATVAGLVIFFGSVYVLVALNAGWRFGYWVTFATLGGLMVFMSVFWLAVPLGPRGEEPIWVPLAFSEAAVGETQYRDDTFQTPPSYPSSPWNEPSDRFVGGGAVGFARDLAGIRQDYADPLFLELDLFRSAISNCLGYDENQVEETQHRIEEWLPGWERTVLEGRFHMRDRLEREAQVCAQLHQSLPTTEDLPEVAPGLRASVTYDVTGIRFTEESGTLLGQAVITPNTYDPRVTGDETGEAAEAVGDSITVLAYRDPGGVRYPAWVYLFFWTAFLGVHLWGLARAERRKLNPVAA